MAALTPEGQQMLCTQPMDDGESGAVLRDFEPLLAFRGDNTPPVSPKYPLLPMGVTGPSQRPDDTSDAARSAASATTGVCSSPCPVPLERLDPVVRALRKESHGEAPCSPQGQTLGKREERPRGQPS
jgi:hypothetical protein